MCRIIFGLGWELEKRGRFFINRLASLIFTIELIGNAAASLRVRASFPDSLGGESSGVKCVFLVLFLAGGDIMF